MSLIAKTLTYAAIVLFTSGTILADPVTPDPDRDKKESAKKVDDKKDDKKKESQAKKKKASASKDKAKRAKDAKSAKDGAKNAAKEKAKSASDEYRKQAEAAKLRTEKLVMEARKRAEEAKKLAEQHRHAAEKRIIEAKKRNADAIRKALSQAANKSPGNKSPGNSAKELAERSRKDAIKRIEEARKHADEYRKRAEEHRARAEQQMRDAQKKLAPQRGANTDRGPDFESRRKADEARKRFFQNLRGGGAEQAKRAAELRRQFDQRMNTARNQESTKRYQDQIAKLTDQLKAASQARDQMEAKLKEQYEYLSKLKAETEHRTLESQEAKAVAADLKARSRELEDQLEKHVAETDAHRKRSELVRREYEAVRNAMKRELDAAREAADVKANELRERSELMEREFAEVRRNLERELEAARNAADTKKKKKDRGDRKKDKRRKRDQKDESASAPQAIWVPSKTSSGPTLLRLNIDGQPKTGIFVPSPTNPNAKATPGITPKTGFFVPKPLKANANIVQGFRANSSSARVEEKGRSIRLNENNGKINIVVVEKKDGQEEVHEYKATNLEQLKKQHPQAFGIYQSLKNRGFTATPQQLRVQSNQAKKVQIKKGHASPSDAKIEVEVEVDEQSGNQKKRVVQERRVIVDAREGGAAGAPLRIQLPKDALNGVDGPVRVQVQIDADGKGAKKVEQRRIIIGSDDAKHKPAVRKVEIKTPEIKRVENKRVQLRLPEIKKSNPPVVLRRSQIVKPTTPKLPQALLDARRNSLRSILKSMKSSQDEQTRKLIEKWLKELGD